MVIEKAYAKVNLFINVLDARKDGYHDLEMINAKINLFDTLKIEKTNCEGLVIIRSNDLFLSNQNNIVFDTARYMMHTYVPQFGIQIEIDKKIPFGAGLAGNSVDAASIIKGINTLFELNLSNEEMIQVGLKFGADIPYCLVDYPALVEGLGEKITKIDFDFSSYKLLLINPRVYIATKDIFTIGNRKGFINVDINNIKKAIVHKNIDEFIANMHNALQEISIENNQDVALAKARISTKLGEKGLVMTGSGSTFIKLMKEVDQATNDFLSEYRDNYFMNIYNFL
ncbi:MAG: 4-(cytidine 5'-diphospho)-2-C-methyl-D-erythritol kinase [Firmicutes bacterium]|nr:4-(cytidine 5'-diphospho)-2-C-methyl-D-erythritol kinase [Bacillota bacterium]